MKSNGCIFGSFENFCAERGLKRTVQRRAVYEVFKPGHVHLSVDDVLKKIKKRLPLLTEESLYRILSDFERAGFIRRVDVPGIMRFELSARPHSHFVCLKCGKIVDIENSSVRLPSQLKGALRLSITANGLCPKCAASGNTRRITARP